MPKSKKTATKSKSQERREAIQNEGQVEARPIGQGKDPLAEGNTLANPTNTEAETHYEVRERSEDVQKTEANASKIAGQNANERAEVHNAGLSQPHDAPNSDTDEQDAVAEGRVEPDGPDANIDDTPEVTPEDDRTEEEIAEGNAEREKALAKDRKTFS